MGCYSSCFQHSLGHAKHCGGFVILLASMAWLGNHTSYIWNLVLGCLMWIVWLERNHRSFEDTEKTLKELKVLCKCSLFDWSQCWGFTDCSSLWEFLCSLRIASRFLSLCCLFFVFLVFIIMNNLYCSFLFSLILFLWLLIIIKNRAMAQTSCELIWIKHLLEELKFVVKVSMTMHCDNQATIHIASNPMFHESI